MYIGTSLSPPPLPQIHTFSRNRRDGGQPGDIFLMTLAHKLGCFQSASTPATPTASPPAATPPTATPPTATAPTATAPTATATASAIVSVIPAIAASEIHCDQPTRAVPPVLVYTCAVMSMTIRICFIKRWTVMVHLCCKRRIRVRPHMDGRLLETIGIIPP